MIFLVKTMNMIKEELIKECKRQEESCLYTSTMLYIWLKWARLFNAVLIGLPIILSSVSTLSVLQQICPIFTTSCALLAGIIPTVYISLGFKANVNEISSLAAEFKNLQDRFRQAATIESLKEEVHFNNHFEMLFSRLELARSRSITPPECCFEKARKKIKIGDYNFLVDKNQPRHD